MPESLLSHDIARAVAATRPCLGEPPPDVTEFDCSACGGDGFIYTTEANVDPYLRKQFTAYAETEGDGWRRVPCEECNGTGRVRREA